MDLQYSHPTNPGLGRLSKLPVEIRLLIWDHFSLHIFRKQAVEASGYKIVNRHLGFLCASKAIYNEASNFVYRKLKIIFRANILTDLRCWLTADMNNGYHRLFHSYEDALAKGFGRLPLSKFRKVIVKITQPCPIIPGTILILWLRVLHIAEFLALGEHKSARLYIELLNDDDESLALRAWYEQETPPNALMRNDLGYWGEHRKALHPDFKVLLMPFKRLRQFKSAKITLPKPLEGGRAFAKEVKMLLTRKEPFGTYRDPNNEPLSDASIQRAFQSLNLYLWLTTGSTKFSNNAAKRIGEGKFSNWFRSLVDRENKLPITSMYNEARKVVEKAS